MCCKTVSCILLMFLFINYVYSAVNYNLKLKGIEHDEGIKNPFLDLKDLKLRKHNKTHYAIDGLFSVIRDNIEKDNFLISITAAQKLGNGYQDSPLMQLKKQNYCDLWANEKYIMPKIRDAINDTNYQCPAKVGTYALINYIPDTSQVPPNSPTGLWRISFVYYEGDNIIGGYKVYVELKSEMM